MPRSTKISVCFQVHKIKLYNSPPICMLHVKPLLFCRFLRHTKSYKITQLTPVKNLPVMQILRRGVISSLVGSN
jgi:hypothetical protein